MKNKLLLGLIFFSAMSVFSQKWQYSAGLQGNWVDGKKYTGYDLNLIFAPKYTIKEFDSENSIYAEIQPAIGVGFRNWHENQGTGKDVYPSRISYSVPIVFGYNYGINATENSMSTFGFYAAAGYGMNNVISSDPSFDAIQGIVLQAGLYLPTAPIGRFGFSYTIGNSDKKTYSVVFMLTF